MRQRAQVQEVLRALTFGWLLLTLCCAAGAATDYFPPPGEWQQRSPTELGFDAVRLEQAVAFARASETRQPRDLAQMIAQQFGREPHNDIIGPTKPRGPATGLIVRRGYLVASWGEPDRVDMTFSVTKSFLSLVAGIAWDRGLMGDLDSVVAQRLDLSQFRGGDKARITWNHLLRQTSGWQGELWGKPDWADRPSGAEPDQWPHQPATEPGAVFEYNDVRVNLLALALLHLFEQPLPDVLRASVMAPIGASDGWSWHGYDNSWVEIGGRRVQSVSGGGHWGGGLQIDSYDLARFGLLTLHRGRWGERRVYGEAWHGLATTPTGANPGYGFMNFFLNRGSMAIPGAPASSFYHLGSGANVVYVDPEHDLVVVARWIDGGSIDRLIQLILAALQ